MGSVDTISVLFVASSICLIDGLSVLSGECEESTSNTRGGMNTIPIPMQSIRTDIIEVGAIIATLFTCYYYLPGHCKPYGHLLLFHMLLTHRPNTNTWLILSSSSKSFETRWPSLV